MEDRLQMLLCMAQIIGLWGLSLLLITGIGLPLMRTIPGAPPASRTFFTAFWAGFGALIFLLQLWHLVLPVDGRAAALAALLGAAGLVARRQILWRFARRIWRPAVRLSPLWLLFLLWIANRAYGPFNSPDAYAYHFPSIHWNAAHPIIPGLANLHDRFASNQTYHLFLALFSERPFGLAPHNIGPGVMLLGLGLPIFTSTRRLILAMWDREGKRGRGRARRIDWFAAALLPPFLFNCLYYPSSPNSDLAGFVMGLILGLAAFDLLARPPSRRLLTRRLLFFLWMAALAVTMKLTLGALGAALTLGVALRFALARRGRLLPSLALAAAAPLLMLTLWMGRGIISNGYPLAPLPIAIINTPWAYPPGYFDYDIRYHRAYCRSPQAPSMAPDPEWSWVGPWLERQLTAGQNRWNWPNWHDFNVLILTPLLLSIVLAAAGIRRRARGGTADLADGADSPAPWLGIFPLAVAAALVYWFTNGPLPRYLGAAPWLLVASTAAWPRRPARAGGWRRPARFAPLILLLSLAGVGLKLSHPETVSYIHARPEPGPYPLLESAPYIPTVTAHGLTVNVARYNEVCEGVPDPCTWTPHPWLRLRRAGDLRSGFVLEPPAGSDWSEDPWIDPHRTPGW